MRDNRSLSLVMCGPDNSCCIMTRSDSTCKTVDKAFYDAKKNNAIATNSCIMSVF